MNRLMRLSPPFSLMLATGVVLLAGPAGHSQEPASPQVKLNSKVSLTQKEGLLLEDALDYLAGHLDAIIVVDDEAFHKAGLPTIRREPVRLYTPLEGTLADSLPKILGAHKATYHIWKDEIRIIPRYIALMPTPDGPVYLERTKSVYVMVDSKMYSGKFASLNSRDSVFLANYLHAPHTAGGETRFMTVALPASYRQLYRTIPTAKISHIMLHEHLDGIYRFDAEQRVFRNLFQHDWSHYRFEKPADEKQYGVFKRVTFKKPEAGFTWNRARMVMFDNLEVDCIVSVLKSNELLFSVPDDGPALIPAEKIQRVDTAQGSYTFKPRVPKPEFLAGKGQRALETLKTWVEIAYQVIKIRNAWNWGKD